MLELKNEEFNQVKQEEAKKLKIEALIKLERLEEEAFIFLNTLVIFRQFLGLRRE